MKKFIPVFLLFFLMIPGMLFAQKKGDVNNDGKVDIDDVNIVVNIILGSDSADKYGGRADVDGVDGVDISDVNVIINILLLSNN